MRTRFLARLAPWLPIFTVTSALALAGACGSKEVPASATPPGGGKKVDAATAGSLSGRVVLTGTPPPVETIRMNTDPVCAQNGATAPSEAVIVSANGGIANAFVYVKDGVDSAYTFDVPTTPVVLDQKGCRYSPRVLGVRVGQPLNVINSDPTLHNVHAMPMVNQEFNQGQPVQNVPLTKTFTAPEVMVRFICNVHGWMHAYVGVMSNPFFAVTDENGAFKIAGLPPGTYTIGVWHEKFGPQEAKVTIADKQDATLDLTYATK